MDKTIVRRASFGPFMLHVLSKHHPWRLLFVPLMLVFALLYGAKLISRGRLKELNLWLLLGRSFDPAKTQVIAKRFAIGFVATDLLRGAEKQLQVDRDAGYRIVLATASCRFYVSEIAKLLEIEDVIATELHTDGAGRSVAKIDGENCYAEGKLRMVNAWLAARDINRGDAMIRFYSDHVSDAPCLEMADEAFATNPHAPLRALAQSKGWPICDWLSES